MLSNAYFLAKFGFDTAENEPAKNLQNFAKKIANFPNFVDPNPLPSETLMIRTSSQLVRSSAFHDQLSSSFGSRMARRIPARALSRKP